MTPLLYAALAAPALAASPVEEAQIAELDRVRGKIADQVHLTAYDLVDELVYKLANEPVFETTTPVILASVTVPVGLGTGMQALVENHLASVLAHNPTTHIQLVHCPTCEAVVVHSGPEGTIVSRGIDDPETLAKIGGGTGKHALFVDVEAEGTWLVLRARLTEMTPELPIVWSHTLATSTSTPALLRQPEGLKSAAEAREEYLDALHDRGPLSIPLRFAVRSYARPADSQAGIAPPPFLWLQTGIEMGANDARAWTSSLLLGYSFVPQAYQGIMAQARVHRLLTGRVRSLTRPDLYAFVGGAVIGVWGLATLPFQPDPLTSDTVLAGATGDSRTTFGALHLGLDLRVGQRMGVSTFLETMPDLSGSPNLGDYLRIGTIGFRSWGNEVTFWF